MMKNVVRAIVNSLRMSRVTPLRAGLVLAALAFHYLLPGSNAALAAPFMLMGDTQEPTAEEAAAAAAAAALEQERVAREAAEAAELELAKNRGDILEEPKAEPKPADTDDDDATLSMEALAKVADGKGDLPVVPRARLNEVTSKLDEEKERNRLLAEENERLKQAAAPPKKEGDKTDEGTETPLQLKEKELDALQEKYEDAQLDGTPEERKELRSQIAKLQREIAKDEALAEMRAEQSQQSAKEQARDAFVEVYTTVHDAYPFLKPDHPQANQKLNNNINAFMNALTAQGTSAAEALQQAVDAFAPMYAKANGLTTEKTDAAEQLRLAREKEALERAADASLRQPAALPHKTDKNVFAIKVEDLTPAQIAKLPEAEKAKMRGDVM